MNMNINQVYNTRDDINFFDKNYNTQNDGLFFDQTKNIYNTQGGLVSKTQQQIFADSFKEFLKKPASQSQQPVYPDYINKCNPRCCNVINTDLISNKITATNYLNENVCKKVCNQNFNGNCNGNRNCNRIG